ncbi:hypothetical protein [Laribacter hongkongensis]|uniref:hypothetical protein n=1 Tax=Laribacter hongkongensis TaxID=168471 RepID=UPI000424337C|nr:hypothetical protein [Laribacter hongkongensis]
MLFLIPAAGSIGASVLGALSAFLAGAGVMATVEEVADNLAGIDGLGPAIRSAIGGDYNQLFSVIGNEIASRINSRYGTSISNVWPVETLRAEIEAEVIRQIEAELARYSSSDDSEDE